jgi:DNA invertase Pin-like site-specific DNA recombinase
MPKTTNTRPIAATYCRISKDKRKDEAGVDRQQADTLALAKKLGYRVPQELRLVDNDRGATRKAKKTREGFHQLRELVETGAVAAVIVYDLDRFTRNPDELGAWIDAAELNPGVKVITTGDILDLSDDDSIFKARILLAVAEKEARNISRRTKREARAAAEKGVPRWSVRPFGFEKDGTHVKAEAAELRTMYADIIAGRSQASIARDLNDRGVENSTGARWQGATIAFLIRAARNAGLRHYRGEIVGKGDWLPIVDEQTWRDANAVLDARKATRRPQPRSLLSGLVRCDRCGYTMTRSARSYRCIPRSDGAQLPRPCGASILGERIDEHVTGLVLAALGKRTPRPRNGQTVEGSERLAADVLRLQADLEALAAMFGNGEMTLAAFRAAKQPLDARLAAANNELVRTDARAALERIAGPTATLAERWGDLDVAMRSRIIGTVVDEIVVTPPQKQGERFNPDRVDVRWTE